MVYLGFNFFIILLQNVLKNLVQQVWVVAVKVSKNVSLNLFM